MADLVFNLFGVFGWNDHVVARDLVFLQFDLGQGGVKVDPLAGLRVLDTVGDVVHRQTHFQLLEHAQFDEGGHLRPHRDVNRVREGLHH